MAHSDQHALAFARCIVGNLNRPKHPNVELRDPAPPRYDPREIYGLMPEDLRRPIEIREVIARIVDGSELDEFKPPYGQSLVTGFARIHGYPIGIAANTGILFSESALQGAHLIML